MWATAMPCGMRFLSTLSLRRATRLGGKKLQRNHDFYPRSPCGERLTVSTLKILAILFLSTLSLRRATALEAALYAVAYISIHALLAESDRWIQGPGL